VTSNGRGAVVAYLAVAGVVLLLMMLLGLVMMLQHADWLDLDPALFYQVMTVHGTGMVGVAGIGGAAIMWHFVGQHVALTRGIFVMNLVVFVIGAALILGADFIGGFAAGWTFLYPLPGHSNGVWPSAAAATHLLGLTAIGIGFLLLHLDVARAVIAKYGSLAHALGWPQLFGGADMKTAPPPAVVASTMVLIINILGLVIGAAVLVIMLINLYAPNFAIHPLAAKNMIFFFGHLFINATIYMAVIAVYGILPRYTGRPWTVNKPFLAAWSASTIMVLIAYPHHLLMDFAMPTWALVVGQIISYFSGFPILLATAFGTLANVHRSGIKWDLASSLLFVSTLAWAAGAVPAIIDATIVINSVMHNTLWVPGHFHTYLLLGTIAMLLGFMSYLTRRDETAADRRLFWLYLLGGAAFGLSLLAAGAAGVPRRYAVHLPEWQSYGGAGSVAAAVVVIAAILIIARFLMRIGSAIKAEA